jgi:hypothetical protein
MLTSPFIPNQIYNRREFQRQYGGTPQGGIAPCANFPYIFIFTKHTGHLHGYEDHWLNEHVFSYTGEGQVGDMKFVRGNLALRDHVANGKRVFLFEYVHTGFVKFVSEVEVLILIILKLRIERDNFVAVSNSFLNKKAFTFPRKRDLIPVCNKLQNLHLFIRLTNQQKLNEKGL